MIFTSLGVYAEPTIQEIQAQINYGINMILNGKDFNPTDVDGSALRPITYKGRTYLPARALSEAVGMTVDYDVKSKTVILGERKDFIEVNADMFDYLGDAAFTKDIDLLYTPNKTFEWGITNYKGKQTGLYAFFINLDKKYTKFYSSVYLSNESKEAQIILINNKSYDGELLKSVRLNPGEFIDIEFDVSGVEKLYVSCVPEGDAKKITFGEPKLK
jgi:hypothetical protein